MALGTDDGAERRAYKPARRPAQISRRHPRHLRIPGGTPTLKLYFSTMTDQDDIMEFAEIRGNQVQLFFFFLFFLKMIRTFMDNRGMRNNINYSLGCNG